MIIDNLHFENIFSYKQLDINFSDTDFALFVGKTGSGKSAIFDGLFWILYERTARKNYNKKNVIRNVPSKQSFCQGKTNFIQGKFDYEVIREYEDKYSRLIIKRNGRDISHRTPTMVQGQLEEIIGVDYDTFLNMVYFSQGDIGQFLTSDSGKRIEIISDLLKLMVFDSAGKVCNIKINTLTHESSSLLGQISTLTQQINEVDVRGLQRKKKLLESGLKGKYDEMTEASQYLNNVREKKAWKEKLDQAKKNHNTQLENSREILNGIKSQIIKAKKNKIELVRVKKETEKYLEKMLDYDKNNSLLKELGEKKNKFKNLATKYGSKIEIIIIQRKDLEELIKSGGKCSTCLFPINITSIKNMKNIISEWKDELDELLEKHEKVENKVIELTEQIEQTEIEQDRLEQDKTKYTQLKTKEGILIEQIGEVIVLEKKYEYTKTKQKEKLAELKEDYNDAKKSYEYFSKYNLDKFDDYTIKLDKIEREVSSAEDELKQIRFKQTETTKKIRARSDIKKTAEIITDELNMATAWKTAFPKIKLHMINNVIPFIQNQTNMVLTQMLPGKRILFDLEPDRKTNRLGIIIEDYINQVKRQFEGWSGGQKDEMSLSIFMALNKIATIKTGKSFPFVILDEKFSSLDSETRDVTIDILKTQQKDRKIWVNSHVEGIDTNFNQVFQTKMIKGISTVSRIK